MMARSRVKKLKDLLAGSFGEDLEVLEEKYTLLTAPGEHYGSIMLGVVVLAKRNGKEEIVNLVAKILPANEMLRKVFNVGVTFKKEVSAYLCAIPALVGLQREYNVPDDRILDMFPLCYGARINLDENQNEVTEDAAIIFENLKTSGYVMEDRLVGFDLAHAQLIVSDLAKFHSTSIALRKLKPGEFQEKIGPTIVQGASLAMLPQSFRDCIFEHSATIEELVPYRERITNFMEVALDALEECLHKPNDTFAAILHSDYWVNNTMVLRDKNGNPLKNKMVDLQLLTFGSCVRDLLFFLFTSVVNAVLDEHYENLIKLYHSEFVESIKYYGLDLEQYSWEELEKEIEEVGPTEAYHVLVMIKPIFTERNKITNSLEDFQESDWNRHDLLGDSYRRKLKDSVIALSRRKWL